LKGYMRTIVIDVQLAPSGNGNETKGVDIFKPSEKIKKRTAGTWFYVDENGDARHSIMRTSDHPWLKDIKTPILAQIVIKIPREAGNYWVKYKGKWKVAQWSPNNWYLAGHGLSFSDSEFDEIDETIIERTT